MSVGLESPERTDARLRRVIARSELVWLTGDYAFADYPVEEFPSDALGEAIAFVRDEDSWSVLRPARAEDQERFAIFSIHFPDELDNSGFIGWLATALKSELGSGVVVVCGQNQRRGGIFDHWGIPAWLRDAACSILAALRNERE